MRLGRRSVVYGVVVCLFAGVLTGLPPVASAAALVAAGEWSVPVWPLQGNAAAPPSMPSWQVPERVWPSAGSQRLVLDGGAGAGVSSADGAVSAAGSGSPGGLPVTVRAAAVGSGEAAEQRLMRGLTATSAAVDVEVFDQGLASQAGVSGVVLALTPESLGSSIVDVQVGYGALAHNFGGDWGGRLRLVMLPSCVLSTPQLPQCQVQTPLAGRNDRVGTVVSASVDLSAAVQSASGDSYPAAPAGPVTGPAEYSEPAVAESSQAQPLAAGEPVVLAMTASGSSEAGDWKATSFSATASWAQGGSSGDFTYSVPVEVPDVPGGLKPGLSFNYSSGSLDGKTKSANAQSSVLGDGWDFELGFVERTYQSCAKDGRPASNAGDWCWAPYLPMNMVLSGKSTRILWDASAGWKTEDDSLGWRFESLSGAANGVNGGQYWKVTTGDGTQYFFGSRPRATNNVSTLRATVFGNNAGEPCYNTAGFNSSHCHQGYRWNLDKVVDVHGNRIDYLWGLHYQGRYGANANTAVPEYDLASHVNVVEYGANSVAGSGHVARVELYYAYRCLDSQAVCDQPGNAHLWPDTPRDQYCALSASSCPALTWQAFYTPYRLTQVLTRVATGPGAWSGNPTHAIDLGQFFPSMGDWVSPAGDDTPPALWLQTLTVAGRPSMNFYGTLMSNRVHWGDSIGVPPMNHYRMGEIRNGTGESMSMAYHGQDCYWNNYPSGAEAGNTRRCYPGHKDDAGAWVWYHKHLLMQVIVSDTVGGGPAQRWLYDYPNWGSKSGVLWHFDTDLLATSLNDRTWNVFRGYPTVRTTVQDANLTGPVQVTESTYYRGMNGDRTNRAVSGWTVRDEGVTDYFGGWDPDHPALAGQLRYAVTFNGAKAADGSNWTTLEIHKPTVTQTGAQAVPDNTQIVANRVRETGTVGGAKHSAGITWTEAASTYDTRGRRTVFNDMGEVPSPGVAGLTGDDRCTRTTYAENTTLWLIDFPVQQTVGGPCNLVPSPPHMAWLSGTRTHYDGLAHGQIGSRGLVTKTEALAAVSTASATWQQQARASYDLHGRVLDAYDPLDYMTSIVYTPAHGGPVTQTATTGPKGAGWTATTTFDPRLGLPTQISDVNGKKTSAAYDNYGRLTSVWKNNRPTTATPDIWYGYWLRGDGGPSLIHTKTLQPGGNQTNSYQLFDGSLRLRQTQTDAASGAGMTIVDTRYNGRGQVAGRFTFWVNQPPGYNNALWDFDDDSISVQQRYTYDNLGRQITAEEWTSTGGNLYGQKLWQTDTVYDGNRLVKTTPPDGGTATTTVYDARGQIAQLRQHHTRDVTAGYDATGYTHDRLGRLTKVVDAAGNEWTYTYDLLGRKTETSDPDAGTSVIRYDAAGRVTSTKNALNQELFFDYDLLGRKEKVTRDSADGPVLADWTYDTIYNGQLYSTRRYHSMGTYTTTVNSYDQGYRPLSTTYTVPGFGLGGTTLTYTVQNTYTDSGAVATTTLPAAGGLPSETLTHGYTPTGLPDTLTAALASGSQTYVADIAYLYDGLVDYQLFGPVGKQVKLTNTYDPYTRRLSTHDIGLKTSPSPPISKYSSSYTYDHAGNITAIVGTTNTVADQQECFSYDHLRRLTEAWTQTSGACTTTTTGKRTGADPYWRQWTPGSSFDVTGNRLSQIDRNPAGGDTTWTYHHGGTDTCGGTAKAHQLRQADASGPLASVASRTFCYDAAGNMTKRTTETGATQTLGWDKEGHLATLEENGVTTTYIYDTAGNRLISSKPGKQTLYLPDGTELEKIGGADPLGKRYYAGIAIRNAAPASLTWTVGNHQGTSTIQIDAATLTHTRRRYLPYGEPRGTQPTGWLGTKGYVGGTTDDTGLTHLGAREYDPTLGRFISIDPIMDLADPQQWHAYSYAANSPVTYSDPTGLLLCGDLDCNQTATPAHGGGYDIIGNLAEGAASCAPDCPTRGVKVDWSRVVDIQNWEACYGRERTGICTLNLSGLPEAPGRTADECGKTTAASMWGSPGNCFTTWTAYEEAREECLSKGGKRYCDRYGPQLPQPVDLGQPANLEPSPVYTPPTRAKRPNYVGNFISIDACFMTCLGLSGSEGGVQLVWTRVGTFGLGGNVGRTTVTGDKTAVDSNGICMTIVLGYCTSYGKTTDGGDWEGEALSVGGKFGYQGGPTKSWCILFCP